MEKRCSTSKGGHVGFNPTFQLTGDQFSLSWISPLFFASCLVRDLLQVHSSRKSVVSMHEINGSLTFQRKVAGCWADFILKKNYNRHIMNLGWSSASIIDVVCLHTKYIGTKQNPRETKLHWARSTQMLFLKISSEHRAPTTNILPDRVSKS